MTREKKELLKKLDRLNELEYIENSIDGSGECGDFIFEHFESLRRPIYEKLDELMHGRLNDYFQACVI
jgi:hypothetical protein